jgi:hypothetical protein
MVVSRYTFPTLVACVVFALSLVVATPTQAQLFQREGRAGAEESIGTIDDQEPALDANLPDWARTDDGAGTTSDELSGGAVTNAGPGLPGPPNRVPVDGGLVLLALAGAGYATRRLRDDGAVT